MKQVEIYTDGACSGNPGRGGWGTILVYKGKEKVMSGFENNTTNNRMELTAAIMGLEALTEPCRVELYSDSKYLVDANLQGWLDSWVRRGWKKADKSPVLNRDLWERFLMAMDGHEVTFHWVKGHDGHVQNERCDRLAVAAIENGK
ncbi:MAG: ribonuclease HI [Clostridia bacterium]|nr:ribonuclease HI [Clostridia bacterium]